MGVSCTKYIGMMSKMMTLASKGADKVRIQAQRSDEKADKKPKQK